MKRKRNERERKKGVDENTKEEDGNKNTTEETES